jgi:hypothetical protein
MMAGVQIQGVRTSQSEAIYPAKYSHIGWSASAEIAPRVPVSAGKAFSFALPPCEDNACFRLPAPEPQQTAKFVFSPSHFPGVLCRD